VVKWKTCLVYLDDVIVFSGSRSAHLARVAEVLTLLGNAGLSLKLKKCRFFSETVDYLGHVIRPGRLVVAEKNTIALKTAPLPRTQTELRSFLGLCNVYRRFVPRFSTIATPLNVMLCKGMPPQLGPLPPAAFAAFTKLRDRLLSPPVLSLPRTEVRLCLDTNASDGQLGCFLLQDQPDGKQLPLGFWSRTLNSAERNYSTTEKECLAIVWAVTHLRPYLEGTEFTVRTDHHALRWVMNISDAQGRFPRWLLRLAEFTFKVEYHPGVAHHAADAMSRLPHQAVPSDPIEEEIPVRAVAHEESQEPEFPTALEEVTSDPITEIPILHMDDLFESQCMDPTARRNGAARVHDPTWDYDRHGILADGHPPGKLRSIFHTLSDVTVRTPSSYPPPRTAPT
jgi:RNase H-like domain found in reverse transcriptase/Reverse transcriptase (RNA-dependent DNA polymerase)